MNKKTLNTICFIVSAALFVWGFLTANLNRFDESITTPFVGVSFMVIGAAGFLYILHLFNRDAE